MKQEKKRPTRKMNGSKILGIGLSARRALCVHPEVSKLETREKVDAGCR